MADDPNEPKSAANQSKTDQKAKAEPSGYKGDNPATAGPGSSEVSSDTPENKQGHLNPSAPEDSNTTPGTTGTK